MNADRLARELAALVPDDRRSARVALAPLTTFQIGGPADWLIQATSPDEVRRLVELARETGAPLTVLGGGSNVLVPDEGIRGLVVQCRVMTIAQTTAGHVRAGAGVTVNGLVRWTVGRGLAGLERWAGTPGTVGGAIYGNAHFDGQDIGQLVDRVQVVTRDGRSIELRAEEMEFGYDRSRLQRSGEILVSADFVVGAGVPDELRRQARESLAYRKRTQPLALPSAGCIFQNPRPDLDQVPEGIPWSAGALIDGAGLKGAREGGAGISEAHANFIVNHGGATAGDVRALIARARDAVRAQFGVDLRLEVVLL